MGRAESVYIFDFNYYTDLKWILTTKLFQTVMIVSRSNCAHNSRIGANYAAEKTIMTHSILSLVVKKWTENMFSHIRPLRSSSGQRTSGRLLIAWPETYKFFMGIISRTKNACLVNIKKKARRLHVFWVIPHDNTVTVMWQRHYIRFSKKTSRIKLIFRFDVSIFSFRLFLDTKKPTDFVDFCQFLQISRGFVKKELSTWYAGI